jgi:hypothetical protein
MEKLLTDMASPWFHQNAARTHDLPYWRRARSPLHHRCGQTLFVIFYAIFIIYFTQMLLNQNNVSEWSDMSTRRLHVVSVKLPLLKSSSACWSRANWISSSAYWNLTCINFVKNCLTWIYFRQKSLNVKS